VRYLGVSNIYDPEMLEWMIGEARLKLGVVQNRSAITCLYNKGRINEMAGRWYEGNGWDWDSESPSP